MHPLLHVGGDLVLVSHMTEDSKDVALDLENTSEKFRQKVFDNPLQDLADAIDKEGEDPSFTRFRRRTDAQRLALALEALREAAYRQKHFEEDIQHVRNELTLALRQSDEWKALMNKAKYEEALLRDTRTTEVEYLELKKKLSQAIKDSSSVGCPERPSPLTLLGPDFSPQAAQDNNTMLPLTWFGGNQPVCLGCLAKRHCPVQERFDPPRRTCCRPHCRSSMSLAIDPRSCFCAKNRLRMSKLTCGPAANPKATTVPVSRSAALRPVQAAGPCHP